MSSLWRPAAHASFSTNQRASTKTRWSLHVNQSRVPTRNRPLSLGRQRVRQLTGPCAAGHCRRGDGDAGRDAAGTLVVGLLLGLVALGECLQLRRIGLRARPGQVAGRAATRTGAHRQHLALVVATALGIADQRTDLPEGGSARSSRRRRLRCLGSSGTGGWRIAGARRTGGAGKHEENGKFSHELIIRGRGPRSSVHERAPEAGIRSVPGVHAARATLVWQTRDAANSFY